MNKKYVRQKLKSLAEDFANSSREQELIGSKRPEEQQEIAEGYIKSRQELYDFINKVTK